MLGQREEQKRRTRARILAAARKLFDNPGYDATTIRMIATEAGVAVGSVFTTFESKEDVLLAITWEMLDQLADEMQATFAAIGGTAREKAKVFFAEAFIAMQGRLPLMMVHLGLAWRWSHAAEVGWKGQLEKVFGIMVNTLAEGVRSGELRADIDIPLLTEVLADIFIRNVRRAWYLKLDAASVANMSARQIDLIFDGVRGQRTN
jgi:TetR/AcrR family transcriptional regulator, cholesterol catabolism regulator